MKTRAFLILLTVAILLPLGAGATSRDLTIQVTQCPNSVHAGQQLNSGFDVRATSTFTGAVSNVTVDLVLTSAPTYSSPAPFANYSPNYSNGVLLLGGREHISFAGPGTISVPLNGQNTIPADTPPGTYYLGTVVDAGNAVQESNERNNADFCRMKVTPPRAIRKPSPAGMPSAVLGRPAAVLQGAKKPDLVVDSVAFKKVAQKVDVQGNVYWIFNVVMTVKNQGGADAGPFKVFLERNNGPGGSFQNACATCTIGVAGLAAGAMETLPPRQFNNANGVNSKFRTTADVSNVVAESDETNNRNIAAFVP